MENEIENKFDCVVVGAGPAGLTALEYLARFHRKAVALGAGGNKPRLLSIDRTYNLPGYPEGVPGATLLARLREQAETMGGEVRDETATHIDGKNGDFTVRLSNGEELHARKIILAMGVRDRHPDVPDIQPHIGRFIRYCPVCDGYEHTGKHLGILGSGGSVARHALFLQTFSNRISIFLHGESAETLGRYRPILEKNEIEVFEPRVVKIIQQSEMPDNPDDSSYSGCGICLQDGSEHPLAVLYSALGCELHLECVQHLGIDRDEDDYIRANVNQETNIPGIYAAGDLVSQINQISVAFGQAAIAAVRIHNELDDEE
ncbi:MAG TPA: NAD(P)/FAD-dependent oxidoreductase [Abditibacteriaceae bacterium]|jgi:thioredoxin reductase (NADPH)